MGGWSEPQRPRPNRGLAATKNAPRRLKERLSLPVDGLVGSISHLTPFCSSFRPRVFLANGGRHGCEASSVSRYTRNGAGESVLCVALESHIFVLPRLFLHIIFEP